MMRFGLVLMLLCGSSWAATYYVASGTTACGGSACADTNNGTSKATAWLHAPGMPNCANTCAATTVNAGDSIIFRGGDTWHYSSGTVLTGGTWAFSRSGSSGNPIYIGVDLTWFAGGSFARPILSGDNPLSTSFPGSCSFTDDSLIYVTLSGSWVTFDNFEFTGDCQTSSSLVEFINITSAGNNRILSNLYFHGWTLASGVTDDRKLMLNSGDTSTPPTDIATLNVFDGSDSSGQANYIAAGSVAACWNGSGTPPSPCATGWAMAGNWGNVNKSVFRFVSNAMEIGEVSVLHDNLFDHIFEGCCGRHGNVLEFLGSTGAAFTAYNNITRHINEGQNWNPSSQTQIIFNNVWEDDQHFSPDPNCLLMEPLGNNATAVISITFYNNTTDGTCAMSGLANTASAGSSAIFANNHILDRLSIFGSSKFFTAGTGNTYTTQTDNGGEIFQTTAVANGQGYTLSNDFSPTLGSSATVHAGINASASCSTFSSDNALCSGTSKGVSEASGSGGFVASYPAIPLIARGTLFDAGAYQFAPPPPTLDMSLTGLTMKGMTVTQ